MTIVVGKPKEAQLSRARGNTSKYDSKHTPSERWGMGHKLHPKEREENENRYADGVRNCVNEVGEEKFGEEAGSYIEQEDEGFRK